MIEMSAFDILLLFIIAMTASIIIGVTILYFVDKKLNDISINVPACPAPVCPVPICPGAFAQPETINNSEESPESEAENIEEFVDVLKSNEGKNDEYLQTNQTVLPMVITTNGNKNNKERILLKQGYNSNGSDTPNTGDLITYPNADDVMRYRGPGCYQNIDTKNVRKLKLNEINTKTCQPYTDKSIRENAYNKVTTKFITPTPANGSNVATRDAYIFVPKLYMGKDPYIDGISYATKTIEIPADIDQIGSIPVNDYDGEPVPIGSFMS
jgi:hypothetical protein